MMKKTSHLNFPWLLSILLVLNHAGPVPAQGSGATGAGSQSDGDRFLDLGKYTQAETYFANALKGAGKKDRERAYLQTGLAESLLNQGRFQEAAKEYKKAQTLVEGDESNAPLKARLYDGLSWLSHAQGKLEQAQDYCRKAIALRKAGGAQDGPFQLVDSLAHMAYIMDVSGNLSRSAEYYKQALAAQNELAGGENTLPAADILERLGTIEERLGNRQEAQARFQQSLKIKWPLEAPITAFSNHPYWENVVFRYAAGSPNCIKRFEGGAEQEVITANGVTVAAALLPQPVEAAKVTEVRVLVRNESGREIQFLPSSPAFIVMSPKVEISPQVDPAKLAQSIEKKGDRKAAWIRFWGQDATRPVTTTFVGNPGILGYAPIYGYGGSIPFVSRSGNLTTVTTQVPDYQAQARALAKAAAVSDNAHRNADVIKATGLGPASIASPTTLAGSLYFDSPKSSRAVLRIPVGNSVFEFIFPSDGPH